VGELLHQARSEGYAVGAFNVYTLEGVRAVVAAAEEEESPVILQVLPSALRLQGRALLVACLAAAEDAAVPVAVQLDHAGSLEDIRMALEAGVRSVMADGSRLPFEDNVAFTRAAVEMVRAFAGTVEGELGRIAGREEGEEQEGELTDPEEAAAFVAATDVDALAVCIGNVHGRPPRPVHLDFGRLRAIRAKVQVPLVLHGASGLPEDDVHRAIDLGICKLNVNTELQEACLQSMRGALCGGGGVDLPGLLRHASESMRASVRSKLRLFRSPGCPR
jgi:tagatose 1,6-diphosphate aldolase GatY/KbaY